MDFNKIRNGLGPEVMYEAVNLENEEENVNEENSFADVPVSYTQYIQDSVFVGEFPFEVILEGLRNQFANYIATEDRFNYVDIFYKQYDISREVATEEDFSTDCLDALSKYMDQFLATMQELFLTKLSITLMDLEGNETNSESAEQSIRLLYDFFVLYAPETFKKSITAAIYKQYLGNNMSDKEYYKAIQDSLSSFSPMVLAVGPMEFLALAGNKEVQELFTSGRVVGNFLRRFSPRLYNNPDFEAALIAHITEVIELNNEIKGGTTNGTTEDVNQHPDS